MKQEAIISFFRHIATREGSHGISNAFRFKGILSSRKKGDLQKSRYDDDDTEPGPAPLPVRRRKSKGKDKSSQAENRQVEEQTSIEEVNDTSPENEASAADIPVTEPGPAPLPVRRRKSKGNLKDKSSQAENSLIEEWTSIEEVNESLAATEDPERVDQAARPLASRRSLRKPTTEQTADIPPIDAQSEPRRSMRNQTRKESNHSAQLQTEQGNRRSARITSTRK
jgi:hypothetical protein